MCSVQRNRPQCGSQTHPCWCLSNMSTPQRQRPQCASPSLRCWPKLVDCSFGRHTWKFLSGCRGSLPQKISGYECHQCLLCCSFHFVPRPESLVTVAYTLYATVTSDSVQKNPAASSVSASSMIDLSRHFQDFAFNWISTWMLGKEHRLQLPNSGCHWNVKGDDTTLQGVQLYFTRHGCQWHFGTWFVPIPNCKKKATEIFPNFQDEHKQILKETTSLAARLMIFEKKGIRDKKTSSSFLFHFFGWWFWWFQDFIEPPPKKNKNSAFSSKFLDVQNRCVWVFSNKNHLLGINVRKSKWIISPGIRVNIQQHIWVSAPRLGSWLQSNLPTK